MGDMLGKNFEDPNILNPKDETTKEKIQIERKLLFKNKYIGYNTFGLTTDYFEKFIDKNQSENTKPVDDSSIDPLPGNTLPKL